MEKRLSYTIVGAFVIVLSVCLVAFMFWLGKYGNKATEYDYYLTYFEESVSGLNIASLVKLRGVEVGRVKNISINKNNSEEVEVLLEINKGTPIKVDSYTTLDSQGITGLKYIELRGGSKSAQLKKTSKDNIATIISKKSMLTSLMESGESITTKIDDILIRVSTVLSDENLENISDVIHNLSSTTTYIDTQKESIEKMFKDITELKLNIENNIDKFTNKSGKFLDNTTEFENELLVSFKKIGDMSDKAADASDKTRIFFEEMRKELNAGQFSVADIVEENLQIMNETALALKDLSIELDETVKELGDSPSDILYKSSAKNLGPGEVK